MSFFRGQNLRKVASRPWLQKEKFVFLTSELWNPTLITENLFDMNWQAKRVS